MSGIFNSLKNLTSGSKYSGQDTRLRFSVAPLPGDSGFTQWHDAMKMVARLPGGIPSEFRRRLWLTLAEKHLQARGVDWTQAERAIFNEWSNPDDDELGIQIVKDLHRTGCQLFCGAAGERNQALLKRVLLAYARWNKAVGYCQGFNMLAALILQVMERSEADSVKVMIYLIEGVLPESYFANNLRGLSVDMAVFRELLRMRLPALSKHLETLQSEAGDATGTSYEPPLTNVFTMQWFLTLFANCLPQATVLRVWDLVFLEGNEVLLRTALAIWTSLEDRIMAVESADEFYSIMGVLTREMLEFGLMDPNNLVKIMVNVAPFPFPELPELRDRYTYNITPWSHSVSNAARRGLRLFQSDDDEPDEEDAGDDEKMAVAAAFGVSAVFRSSPRRRGSLNLAAAPDKERLNLDISALKQQYSKLRERQRQAHIILSAACARQPGPTRQVATASTAPVVMNHLLLGRSALLGVRRGNAGTVPANSALHQPQRDTSRVPKSAPPVKPVESGETLHWRDAKRRPSTTLENIKTPSPEAVLSPPRRSRSSSSSSTTSSASSASSSSGSTELCDEPDKMSDFDNEETLSNSPRKNKDKKENINIKDNFTLPLLQLQSDISPIISPPSEASSPTEEASSQDRISQISLSPIMNSPSMSTIQNSATSTLQNSPINTGSPTLIVENSVSEETIISINQDYSMSENTLQFSETINDLPSLSSSPTKDHIPITLTSPEKMSILYSPTEKDDVSADNKTIPNFIDLNSSPQKDRLKSPMCKMTSIDQATSPIDWSKIDLTDEIKTKSNQLQKNSPDLITSHWVDPKVVGKITDKSSILKEASQWDSKNTEDYKAISKDLLIPESSPVDVSWKTPDGLQKDISWDTVTYSEKLDVGDVPSWKSPEECSTNQQVWKTPAESPKELPPWNTPEVNELLSWEKTTGEDNKNVYTHDWTKTDKIDVIKSEITEQSENLNATGMQNEEVQKPLDDHVSDSVFLTQGASAAEPIVSSPMRIVPLGSLSASLSSPSSNEDDTLPDLMVITPPKELSPLSPLKSPWSSDNTSKYTSETISWDKTKFPFPVKSPVLFEKVEESSVKAEDKIIAKSPEFNWKYPIPENNSTEDNLINWEHSPKKENLLDSEPQTSEWKSNLSWSDISENEWKNDTEEWKTREDKWTVPSSHDDEWEADSKVRDSASDAPASPLPSNERDITENWHKLPPQFPSLTESSVTSTPNLSPLKDSWHSTPKNSKLLDTSDVETIEKSPEKTPKIRKKKSIRFDTSPEGKAEGKSDNSDSRRKRWTIAEPIEWSAICDALNQQENTPKNIETEESKTVEEDDEETIKEIEERGAFGRRNSERALQIIQENSEILQRIMRESRGKQLMERETRAARPTTIGLGGSRGVRWGSQRALTVAEPESTPPLPESPTNSWKPSTCFPSLGESPQTTSPTPFNPFPVKQKIQPKELGVKLGLYPTRQVSK